MRYYEINRIDCSKKEQRVFLVKSVMKVCKFDHKPSLEELKDKCKKLKAKYNVNPKFSKSSNSYVGRFFYFNQCENGKYFIVCCPFKSEYEMRCKYILHVARMIKEGSLPK